MYNGLYVVQIPGTQSYDVFTPQRIHIARLFLSNGDGQYIRDAECIVQITKALAQRWGMSNRNQKI